MNRRLLAFVSAVAEKAGFAVGAVGASLIVFRLSGSLGLISDRLDVFAAFTIPPAAALLGLFYERRDRWVDRAARPLLATVGLCGLVATQRLLRENPWVLVYLATEVAFAIAVVGSVARLAFPLARDREQPISRLDRGLEPAASAQQELIARALGDWRSPLEG